MPPKYNYNLSDKKLGDSVEIIVKPIITDFFKDIITKQSEYACVDFIGNNTYEVKAVDYNFAVFPYVLVSYKKIQKYYDNLESTYNNKDLYLVYRFKDESVYYIKYDKNLFDTFSIQDVKRTNRVYTDKPLYHYMIPLKLLKKIQGPTEKCLIIF